MYRSTIFQRFNDKYISFHSVLMKSRFKLCTITHFNQFHVFFQWTLLIIPCPCFCTHCVPPPHNLHVITLPPVLSAEHSSSFHNNNECEGSKSVLEGSESVQEGFSNRLHWRVVVFAGNHLMQCVVLLSECVDVISSWNISIY